MSRVWQRTSSDAVSWHQDQALTATIYILRQSGPTGFVIKEDGEAKNFRVFLGDPHTCTCPTFVKERVPCKHICWIILKKFKVPRQHELSYQLGLVEREINSILHGYFNKPEQKAKSLITKSEALNSDSRISQRKISDDDVCPVCQEELLKKHQPVTYCRNGCGNNIHIKCMKIWADHQRTMANDNIKCPICRENFGSYQSLLREYNNSAINEENSTKLNVHLATTCNGCNMSPIEGKCHKCATCKSYMLCNICYHGNKHMHHLFVFRLKRTQRWRPAPDRTDKPSLPNVIVNELSRREISDNDYDLLLRLDSGDQPTPVDLCGLPEHVVNSLPVSKIRRTSKLLLPGQQCCLCLRPYEPDQYAKKLPSCGHIFHKECIDKWLLEDHRRCPVDNELVKVVPAKRLKSSSATPGSKAESMGDTSELVIPGIGISKLKLSSPKKQPIVRKTDNSRINQNTSTRRASADLITDGKITFGDLLKKINAPESSKKKPINLVRNRQVFSSTNKRTRSKPRPVAITNVDFWVLGNPVTRATNGARNMGGDSPPVFLSSPESNYEYSYNEL